ncbi:hypothetical protein F442_12494 [Phytophthora nicotianae P10297]|uniref:Tudor domain-containing protein n=1 Tax=Phytophthora nicotianae P10297 TaxID=1317064 RepID=W2Z1L4_PHYNI|nr:hypothetical protein F442_12494 [Phytophthora nicotianae P10297]
MATIYRVGERVDGLYDENTDDMWYPGRIRSVHQGESVDGDTFEVLYDDGEVETNVRPEFLRQHVSGTICVGTRVLGRYDGGEEFYSGQISDVQENGKYTIAYDDGEVEVDVPIEYIMEPKEEPDETAENEEKVPSSTSTNAPNEPEQQQDIEMEEPQDFPSDAQENQESEPNEPKDSEPERFFYSTNKQEPYVDPPQPAHHNEEDSEASSTEVSAERVYIIDSLELLEKRLGDAASAKSVLSTLVKHMRAYPQVTADLVHERGGERLIIDALKCHQSHAVIQCYGFVLLRRLCFLCVKSTHYLLRNGIVELVIHAMNAFAEDAILQASACGALAVFTRVHAGLNSLIEFQVAQLVLSTLIYHKTYSVHTRQVHYYGCEVLLELCELDDLQTLNLLCGEQEEEFTGDMSPISLLLFLLRQGLSLDDKKACCAVGSLLMCLAASGKRAAASILTLNGLSELSTVMARYPTEPSIQKYSAAASKQIALCSVRQSPTKRIKDTANEILRETESLETPVEKAHTKRAVPRRLTGAGKRKTKPSSGYGPSTHSRGTAYSSSTPYRNTQAFSKASSPCVQAGDINSFSYSAPQPSSLVILDGGFGSDSGFGSTNKRKQSREDRQTELLEAYGVHGIPSNSRQYGTKRRQLRAHLASAESTWAAPHQHLPSTIKPLSSRSSHLDHESEYSQGDFIPNRQTRWEYAENSTYEPQVRQPRGAKRKKKNPSARTAFQVKVESDNQLLVSRETHASYPSPQRLGAATKRAAKARQKRISASNHSSLTARSNNPSSESLNEYATHLFQDSAARGGTNYMTSSRLTPREKEEIRERERLSFAEKLHKMIDKAKSSLASGNTTSMPVDSLSRPQTSSAGSKSGRKTREVSVKFSDDTRPKAKKTRTTVSSTPKQFKDISTPREAVETRPAKPTSESSKRVDAPSVPAVSRPKPIISRTTVTPKVSTDRKPRAVAKTTKPAPTKPTAKQEDEKSQESVVEPKPIEIAPAIDMPEINEPRQEEVDVVAAEPVQIPAPSIQENAVPEETKPTEQVEQEASNAEVEVDAIPPVEADTAENKGAIAGDLHGTDAGEKVIEEEPAEEETVNASVDRPAATEEAAPDTTADAKLLPEDAQQLSESPLEGPSAAAEPTDNRPSGDSAVVDAMYGDAFNEFDDNGGDEEEMTAEVEADADETLNPPADMHASKSGEALYDDGYDDFDEDEAQEAEAEDAPIAAEVVENQDEEPTNTQPTEIVADPIVDLPGTEDKQVTEEATPLPVAAAEETPAFAEQSEGDDKSLLGANGDEKGDGGAVDPWGGDDFIPSNAEAEQEPVDVDTEAEDHAHADQVVVVADDNVDTPADNAVEGVPDGEEAEGVNVLEEPGVDVASPTSATEPVEAENVVDDTQPSTQPEDDTSVPSPPNDPMISTEPATEEATANPTQPQQDEEQPTEEANVRPVESLESDNSAPPPDQDEESKKMCTDSSAVSVQSAAYEEDNFDDEEKHPEAETSEAVEGIPVTASTEEPVEGTDQQQQQQEASDNAAFTEGDKSPDPVSSSAQEENESKTLAGNNSELSVHSAVYDDEGFDNGEQDAPVGNAEDKVIEQERNGDEVTESATIDTPSESDAPVDDAPTAPEHGEDVKPEETAEDDKATAEDDKATASAETYRDEYFDNPKEDDAVKEAAEPVMSETVEEPSESQQPETPKSEVVADPTLAGTEPEVPDTKGQEETQNAQEPVVDEPGATNEDAQAENTTPNDSVDVPATYDEDNFDDEEPHQEAKSSVAEVDPVVAPDDEVAEQQEQEGDTSDNTEATQNPTESSADPPEAEAAETAVPSDSVVRQEEDESRVTSAQPETYDDDEFDKGTEEEAAAPANDEPSKYKDPDIVHSEQPSDEAVNTVAAATNNADAPVAVEEVAPESEPQTNTHPEQSSSDAAVDSSIVPDVVNNSVSGVKPEPEVATENPSEGVGDQVESPAEDEANIDPASDKVDNPVLEMTPSEPQPATLDEQPNDQSGSTTFGDKPDASSNAPDNEQAENVPEPEAQSDKPVEVDEKPDQGADYTQGDDAFDEDSSESRAPDNALVEADTSAEPSVDAAQEGTQYEDADFVDAENDASALKDVAPENEPNADEATAANSARPDDSSPAQAEETEPVNDGSAVPTNDTTNDEADDLPATVQVDRGPVETPETIPDAIDSAVGINAHASSSVDQDTSDEVAGEAVTKDEPPMSSSDATAYEEDFPDDIPPEMNETEAKDATAVSTESAAVNNDGTPVAAESPTVNTSDARVDDSPRPSGNVDVAADLPSDEHYDDGFDEENIAPAIDASEPSNGGDEAEPVVTADTFASESGSAVETPEDNIVAGDDQDEAVNDDLASKLAESAAQDQVEVKAEECDNANTAEAEPVEAPVATEQVATETKFVKPEIVETVGTESAEPVPVESETVESESVEPEAAQTKTVEMQSDVVEHEAPEAEAVEPGIDSQTAESTTMEPNAVESEVVSPKATEPDAVETEAVGAKVTGDSVPTEETSIANPVIEEPTASEANQDELSEEAVIAEPVVSDGGDLPSTKAAVEPSVDTPTDTNHQATKDPVQTEEMYTIEDVVDSSPNEKPVEDTTTLAIDALAAEVPAEVTSDEPREPIQSEAENILELAESASPADVATVADDVVEQETAIQSSEVAKEDVAEVRDASTPESNEPITSTEEAQQDQEPDYTEADAPAVEPPIVMPDESTSISEVKQEESPVIAESSPEEPTKRETAEVAEAAEELAVEAEPPQPEPAEDTPRAASEADDQYDDDEAYNEFDDQGNEAPISVPSVEVQTPAAPVATEAPATEDEYENERNEEFENDEEYEHDDYGEDEMAAETPRTDPVVPLMEPQPPVSAREQEIEEVADTPEEVEDAYADDQDEYNNEYEEDDAPAVHKSSPSKEDKPTPQAEASADEYEYDNEEEYADDEIEDNSPPKPAPKAPANKSDDEMEEELGYESDEAYADSDG